VGERKNSSDENDIKTPVYIMIKVSQANIENRGGYPKWIITV